jgi:hypothetical protein
MDDCWSWLHRNGSQQQLPSSQAQKEELRKIEALIIGRKAERNKRK